MKLKTLFARALVAATLLTELATAQPVPPAAPEPAAPEGTAPETAPSPQVREALSDRVPELTVLKALPGGLTADETARRALTASVSVAEKRAELESANAKIRETMIQFFPTLTLRASYTRLSPVDAQFSSGALVGAQNPGPLSTGPCPGGPGECVLDSGGVPVGANPFSIRYLNNNYALGAALSIPLSDYVLRLSDAAASSSASRDAVRLALDAEKLRVQTDARVLYYNWLRSVGAVSIAQKSLERTRARLDDARTAFNVGTTTKADLLRLEALVANTELAVEQATAMRSLANAQLAIVMEDRNAPPFYRVGQEIVLPDSETVDDAGTRRLVHRALQRRLEIKAVEASARSLRRGASAVRAGSLPRVDAVGDLTYANPNQRFFPPQQEWNLTWSAGLTATWNINEIFGSDARADQLDASLQGAQARRVGVEAAVANEVVAARLDLYKAQAAVRMNVTALKAAEEAYRVTTELYRAGQATTTDLIESEAELLNAKLGEVNANIDLVIASIRVRHATGDDLAGARADAPRAAPARSN